MTLKTGDLKKLWGRSGNICSFPGCRVELAHEKKMNRVIGEEAHIKGEKDTAPRYDRNQTPEERESYENRILLCPTHHTEIDSDPLGWTEERLYQMKAAHEKQVVRNRQYPTMVDDFSKLLKKYQAPEEDSFDLSEMGAEDSEFLRIVRVDASKEGGINTKIPVQAGQTLSFFARGLITYNDKQHFATPEGILCNEYGIPLTINDGSGNSGMVVWPHPEAYKTNGNEPGLIGSLIGWIGKYTERGAFLIGSKREIQASQAGDLYLMVNDAKGTYSDNDGEFRVEIKVV